MLYYIMLYYIILYDVIMMLYSIRALEFGIWPTLSLLALRLLRGPPLGSSAGHTSRCQFVLKGSIRDL